MSATLDAILAEFDRQFGIDGPEKDSDSVGRIAGCDDCHKNVKLRAEHREFVRQAVIQSIQQAGQ